jgi:hypothetical protein
VVNRIAAAPGGFAETQNAVAHMVALAAAPATTARALTTARNRVRQIGERDILV